MVKNILFLITIYLLSHQLSLYWIIWLRDQLQFFQPLLLLRCNVSLQITCVPASYSRISMRKRCLQFSSSGLRRLKIQASAHFSRTQHFLEILNIGKCHGSGASYDSTTIMFVLEVRIGETKPIFPFLSLDFLYFCHLFGLREKGINKYVFFAM